MLYGFSIDIPLFRLLFISLVIIVPCFILLKFFGLNWHKKLQATKNETTAQMWISRLFIIISSTFFLIKYGGEGITFTIIWIIFCIYVRKPWLGRQNYK